jgi:uncharacterized protein YbcV (DUF1398 family)
MDNNIINECSKRSLGGTITFPEVVMKLIAANTERYTVDLIGLRKSYFGTKDETHIIDFVLENPQKVAANFAEREIKNTIIDIQQNRINYQTFLNRIIAAGCSHYEVFLTGKKAVYFGRDGSFHIEHFPGE